MITELDKVKLIDFGLAQEIHQRIKNPAGTMMYMAPEQFDSKFSFEVDIWSAGCMLYVMCTGRLPFFSRDRSTIIEKIQKEPYNTDFETFKHLSDECKDLIDKMLQKNPKKRISGTDAIKHPWFQKFDPENSENTAHHKLLKPESLTLLREFKSVSFLKQAILRTLIK